MLLEPRPPAVRACLPGAGLTDATPPTPLRERLRQHLIDLAREGRTTTYFELARTIDFNLDDEDDRELLASTLREISTAEHAASRPMLSALVVLQRRGLPGRGFFELARSLGVWNGRDEAAFHAREVARVWAEWQGGAESPLPLGEAGERSEPGEGRAR